MNEKFVLNNGVEIPKIGFGVFRMTNQTDCENAVLHAIILHIAGSCQASPVIDGK